MPTVRPYTADDQFDLLNLHSYGWGEWFFLVAMIILLILCFIGIGCCVHKYRVKDRILTDEQIKDLEDDMNVTAISASWRRLSRLLTRSSVYNDNDNGTIGLDGINPASMDEKQATRVLGQSICNKPLDINTEMDGNNIELIKSNVKTSVDIIPEEEIEELVGQSMETDENTINTGEDNHNFVSQPPPIQPNITVTND